MTDDDCSCCYREPVTRADGLGNVCGGWADYWVSLTPEQQKAELDLMDLYAAQEVRRQPFM